MLKVGDKVYYRKPNTHEPVYFGDVVRTTTTLKIVKNIYGTEVKLYYKNVYGDGYKEFGKRGREHRTYYRLDKKVEKEIEYNENLIKKADEAIDEAIENIKEFCKKASDTEILRVYDMIKDELNHS